MTSLDLTFFLCKMGMRKGEDEMGEITVLNTVLAHNKHSNALLL